MEHFPGLVGLWVDAVGGFILSMPWIAFEPGKPNIGTADITDEKLLLGHAKEILTKAKNSGSKAKKKEDGG
jgi:hypothetical protein